ncbi:MAG: 1-acyl-sn-glycerol-3-phosphate acyltransferase [Bacteroidia bacterium]|nr:1-acyl-sn-glycerol-3-phosphate acyltransferase [Bacteroidia bacterium]
MGIVIFIYRNLLRLRYKVNIRGIDLLSSKNPKLFLPNHQAIVDPQILFTHISKYTPVMPIVTETYFKIPLLKQVLNSIKAVPVSDLTAGSRDTSVLDRINKSVIEAIKDGKNVLLYPSGQTAEQGFEKIKNKKSAWVVVSEIPENTEIVGVRISGLWGSMWSKAKTGKSPSFFKAFLKGIFIVIINFFFLAPKRTVNIEFSDITIEAKEKAKEGKVFFNTFLEEFYNKYGEEKIKKVKYHFLSFRI